MGVFRYRVFRKGQTKPEAIVDSMGAVKDMIPHGESRIVKRYKGRQKLATYRAECDVRGAVTWYQLSVKGAKA